MTHAKYGGMASVNLQKILCCLDLSNIILIYLRALWYTFNSSQAWTTHTDESEYYVLHVRSEAIRDLRASFLGFFPKPWTLDYSFFAHF